MHSIGLKREDIIHFNENAANRIAFQGLDSTAENKVLYAVDVDFDEGWWLWYYALGSRKSSE